MVTNYDIMMITNPMHCGGITLIKCEYCGRWFKNKRALAAHQVKCSAISQQKNDVISNKFTVDEYQKIIDECQAAIEILQNENKRLHDEIDMITN